MRHGGERKQSARTEDRQEKVHKRNNQQEIVKAGERERERERMSEKERESLGNAKRSMRTKHHL